MTRGGQARRRAGGRAVDVFAASLLAGGVACSSDPAPADPAPLTQSLDLVLADPGTVLSGQRVRLGALPLGGAGGRTMGWTQTEGPAVTLEDPGSIHPSFVAPAVEAATPLRFEATVVDRTGERASRTLSLVVEPAPLTVFAGADQRVSPGQTVALNGVLTGSADVTEVTWVQTLGTPVSLDDVHRLDPTFVAPAVDAGGELGFRLDVTTSSGATVASAVTEVSLVEDWSGVYAGPDLLAAPGEDILLSATARGGLEAPLVWSWTWSSMGSASVAQPGAPATTASLDSGTGWTFTVTVQDAAGRTVQDELSVVGVTPPPGPGLGVETISAVQLLPGVPVRLHAVAGGGDGNYSFDWQDLGGQISIVDGDTANPLVTAPSDTGESDPFLLVEVTDGQGETATDLSTYAVSSPSGVLQAGPDRTVGAGQRVYLTATFNQGAPVGGVAWTKQAGPTFPIEGAATKNPNFVAPADDATLVFTLEGEGVLADEIRLDVVGEPAEPQIYAPARVVSGQRFWVSAALDRPPGDDVSFAWQQDDGPPARLGPPPPDTSGAALEVVAPVVDEDARIQITVVVELASGQKQVDSTFIDVFARAAPRPAEPSSPAVPSLDDRRMWVCEASPRCDLDQGLTTCPPERPYGLNHVRMPGDGTYEIRKQCASAETCWARWWATTRVDADCSALRAAGADLAGLATGATIRLCDICCSGPECNAPTFPDDETLLDCDAEGCGPRP